MQTARIYIPSATGDSPQSATKSKAGVSNDQHGFPAIKVTQFTILQCSFQCFVLSLYFGLIAAMQRTLGWIAHRAKLYVTTSQLAFSRLSNSDEIVLYVARTIEMSTLAMKTPVPGSGQ